MPAMMYNLYKSIFIRSLLIAISLIFSSCVPKPVGLSSIENALFSKYFVSNFNLPLKIRVKGLANAGSFVISNQSSEILRISTNGDFEFTNKLQIFSNFTVSILSQPTVSPNQTCIITNPSGIVSATSNLVEINCGTSFFNVNLNVYGIATSATGSLLVRNGNVDSLSIVGDGNYTFSSKVPDTGIYSVTLLSSPNQHNCVIETVPPATGTINNASVTLNVNCLSLTNAMPVNQTAVNDGSSIQFTFSKPVTPLSCSFTAPTPTPTSGICSSNLGPSAAPLNALSYSGNTVTINPNPAWPGGLNRCIQFSGCTELGTNRPFQIASPIRYGVAAVNQIKYVHPGGMSGVGTCSTIATACSDIQYAITQCSTATPCFVLVSQGTYSITTVGQTIRLIDKLQLIGGFKSDFLDRNPAAFPSIIRDDVPSTNCGASDAGTCTPIMGSMFAMTSDILVQGLTVITNANNRWSTGIWLNNLNTGGFSLTLSGNSILGSTELASNYGLGINRSAIYASNVSPNFVVVGNYILGGSGNSLSSGMRILEGTQGVINSNFISGGSHININDGLDFSIGVMINNTVSNTTQSLQFVNNIFNSYHITAPTPVTVTSTSAVQALRINSPNLIFINNTIYGGSGSTRSYGIHQQSPVDPLNLIIINNQIFTNLNATTSTCLNFDTNNVNVMTSKITRNNFNGCSVLVQATLNQYRLCWPEPDPLFNSVNCATPLTSILQKNYSHDPIFDNPTSLIDVYKLNTASRCKSVYGGNDPAGYGFPQQLYLSDLFGFARTNNVPPTPVPPAAFGYSIGAIEFNGDCVP
ncbi:hypothetical protein LFX25_03585 [Leptospira sp. FAT2]|uniref:hypothetical protein n=1 Tax=Leptospira sanjuanensis TaxID=2879643 RepID=UPI001EE875C2|nr:hypothetical protein [Leptospira sanjuanensis]MCG6192320.1 hypothetical protein [Leptospira sanjuanensis]